VQNSAVSADFCTNSRFGAVVDVVARAQQIADEVLFPASLAVDTSELLPAELLDALADAGLYGLAVPPTLGGIAVDLPTFTAVVEHLASGCLTTTFVFMQHHSAAVAASRVAAHHPLVRELAAGRVRAGVAFAHLRRPDPPAVVATEVEGGWQIDGDAPWVTGWGRIDLVHVAARRGADIVWVLVDAVPSATVVPHPIRLAALDASGTVQLSLHGHIVPTERVTHVEAVADWLARDATTLRTNGSLALGVVRRAAHLLGPSPIDDALDAARRALDHADAEAMPRARAGATDLALRATAALMAAGGGRSIARDQHAQRLAREALFLVVQGQTPTIRAAQLECLVRNPP
jgi:alkylation response protein AidB-like acyl-CoA dehydrogenase